MTFFDALILGIVEGITEFLPISSTGHMILASELLGLEPTDFLSSFEISIQLGAILAVVLIYWRLCLRDMETMKKVAVAFLPTAIIGFALYPFVKNSLLGNSEVVLWALAIGGVVLILFELFMKGKDAPIKELSQMTYLQSFITGVAQSVAVIPGVSRSAATIVGGMLQGIDRKTIVEFSFLLAVPTIGSATALDILKNYQTFSLNEFHLLAVGFISAFITAYFAVKWLLSFVQNHTFIAFGVYRILVALVFTALIL